LHTFRALYVGAPYTFRMMTAHSLHGFQENLAWDDPKTGILIESLLLRAVDMQADMLRIKHAPSTIGNATFLAAGTLIENITLPSRLISTIIKRLRFVTQTTNEPAVQLKMWLRGEARLIEFTFESSDMIVISFL
jgi:hypothetical protein